METYVMGSTFFKALSPRLLEKSLAHQRSTAYRLALQQIDQLVPGLGQGFSDDLKTFEQWHWLKLIQFGPDDGPSVSLWLHQIQVHHDCLGILEYAYDMTMGVHMITRLVVTQRSLALVADYEQQVPCFLVDRAMATTLLTHESEWI